MRLGPRIYTGASNNLPVLAQLLVLKIWIFGNQDTHTHLDFLL